MGFYPIELDLAGRTVLVVGLGTVGARKARGLMEAGARVIGVDPFGMPPEGVDCRREAFEGGHLEGVDLVFAAATAEVNRRVMEEARKRGIWVNSASEPGEGDFTVPAVHRSGLVCVTVSTSGASPALAGTLRDRVVGVLGTEAEEMARLLAEFRPEVMARVSDEGARRRMLLDWAGQDRLEKLRREGPESVRRTFRAELEAACRA